MDNLSSKPSNSPTRRHTARFRHLIIPIVCCILVGTAGLLSYRLGFKAGYQTGQTAGFSASQKDAFPSGQAEGYQTGYGEGYETGYFSGKDVGYWAGYDTGRDTVTASRLIGTRDAPSQPGASRETYTGNPSTKEFHKKGCTMLPEKSATITFTSREIAISAGYAPCPYCMPE